ncbi:MobV family relaxase [Ekhidna sp.]|uniref:MobV family relaxase n=1 Tax=Ekhidna sp. TaxID=2608089 RepID=UPI003296D522
MSYAVIRVEKRKSFGGIGRHIDRTDSEGHAHIPENAQSDKDSLNIHWGQDGKSYSQDEWREIVKKSTLGKRVNDRIKEGYQLTKAIRKDAVKGLEYILTSDQKKMTDLERSPEAFKQWIMENRKFIEDRHGKENIVSFSLHRDETTPHLHVVVVPLTKDGRLSAKDFIGTPRHLRNLNTEYAQQMAIFGMKRGEPGSKREHERPSLNKKNDIER